MKVKVKCDNQSANHIFNGSTMKKSRHFDLEIKKKLLKHSPKMLNDFETEYVDTNSQLADIYSY